MYYVEKWICETAQQLGFAGVEVCMYMRKYMREKERYQVSSPRIRTPHRAGIAGTDRHIATPFVR